MNLHGMFGFIFFGPGSLATYLYLLMVISSDAFLRCWALLLLSESLIGDWHYFFCTTDDYKLYPFVFCSFVSYP